MDLEMFMAGKAETVQDVDYVASTRFKDADGNPIPWKLRALSCDKESDIKKMCMKGTTFDTLKYAEMLTVETIAEPELGNAALQDSYKVVGKLALLNKMLTSGEKNALMLKAQAVNGLNVSMNDLIDDAKN